MEDYKDEWKSIGEIIMEKLPRYMEKIQGPLMAYENATTYFSKLKALKNYYTINHDEIIECGRNGNYCCYPVNWRKLFTPIEYEAWCCIRYKGIVMYPQYPVLNYFLDFANPVAKIALEIDGKDYHNRDSDIVRDRDLWNVGWKVYRITGAEMVNRHFKDYSDLGEDPPYRDEFEREIRRWILTTGDGVISAIHQMYFPDVGWHYASEDERPWFETICEQSLRKHSLISY